MGDHPIPRRNKTTRPKSNGASHQNQLVMTIKNSFDPYGQSTTVRMTVAPSTQDFLHAASQQ
jgi:hypothetical protein